MWAWQSLRKHMSRNKKSKDSKTSSWPFHQYNTKISRPRVAKTALTHGILALTPPLSSGATSGPPTFNTQPTTPSPQYRIPRLPPPLQGQDWGSIGWSLWNAILECIQCKGWCPWATHVQCAGVQVRTCWPRRTLARARRTRLGAATLPTFLTRGRDSLTVIVMKVQRLCWERSLHLVKTGPGKYQFPRSAWTTLSAHLASPIPPSLPTGKASLALGWCFLSAEPCDCSDAACRAQRSKRHCARLCHLANGSRVEAEGSPHKDNQDASEEAVSQARAGQSERSRALV